MVDGWWRMVDGWWMDGGWMWMEVDGGWTGTTDGYGDGAGTTAGNLEQGSTRHWQRSGDGRDQEQEQKLQSRD